MTIWIRVCTVSILAKSNFRILGQKIMHVEQLASLNYIWCLQLFQIYLYSRIIHLGCCLRALPLNARGWQEICHTPFLKKFSLHESLMFLGLLPKLFLIFESWFLKTFFSHKNNWNSAEFLKEWLKKFPLRKPLLVIWLRHVAFIQSPLLVSPIIDF